MGQAAHPFRIGGPAAASLLVNALLIAALLGLGARQDRRRTDSPPITVLSLALVKGTEQSDEAAEAATPPASPPDIQGRPFADAPPVPSLPTVVQATSQAVVTPAQVVALVQTPASDAPVLSQSASQDAASPSTPVSAASPARRGVVEGLDVKAPSGASRSYAAQVRSWLYAHKIYPRRARMRRQEGRVQVRFVLDRAGMLLEGAIVHGSGNAALDDEARAMLRRASPYPRVPPELMGDRIEFIAPIEFILPA